MSNFPGVLQIITKFPEILYIILTHPGVLQIIQKCPEVLLVVQKCPEVQYYRLVRNVRKYCRLVIKRAPKYPSLFRSVLKFSRTPRNAVVSSVE
jgi:hypothetical protein